MSPIISGDFEWFSDRFCGLRGVRLLLFLVIAVSVMGLPVNVAASFESRLQSFRNKARRAGVARSLLDRTFKGVRPDSSVLENLRNQPEFQMKYPRYRERLVTEARIRRGRRLFRHHRQLLLELKTRYGVPSHVLMAVWGVESNYGEHRLQHDVVRALSTLAFTDSGRSDYFREELMTLLHILDRELVHREVLRGSWAGAMGDPQFMPSSYLRYAVDYDGDGQRNIWTDPADVLASIGNYLREHGWKPGMDWGWPQGSRPESRLETRTIRTQGKSQDYKVTANFDVLMRYNPSENYALVIGELAEAIRDER